MPTTSRRSPTKPFTFYFSLMIDAYETTTQLSRIVDHRFSSAQRLFSYVFSHCTVKQFFYTD